LPPFAEAITSDLLTRRRISIAAIMAASPGTSIMPTLRGPGAYNADQVDLIWEMGLESLESNDGELVIPASMQKYLSADQVEDLKSRLR
jgi:hypothetical protein